jgi:hypothetical protein
VVAQFPIEQTCSPPTAPPPPSFYGWRRP